jgi:ABC-type Fe3+ transport system substrate-binding protein
VLGSYAQARIDAGAPLGIVQPEDYTLVMLRTAMIPRNAAHTAEARRFLDYLLSPRGQQILAKHARQMPILPGDGAPDRAGPAGLSGRTQTPPVSRCLAQQRAPTRTRPLSADNTGKGVTARCAHARLAP